MTGILDLKLTNVYYKTKLNFYVIYSVPEGIIHSFIQSVYQGCLYYIGRDNVKTI